MRDEILKDFLDSKVDLYNDSKFIESDPIQVPHSFTKKEDVEIAALLVSTIAWGLRKTIIKNGFRLMELMDNSPYEFVVNHTKKDLDRMKSFKHRTFNGDDFICFVEQLQRIYKEKKGLEYVFCNGLDDSAEDCSGGIENFRNIFFEQDKESNLRTKKHISSPFKGSASKRLTMFLRWMVRQDNRGVDFGIWRTISPSILSCPLDVHSGNVARKLGLIERKQNNWLAVKEMDMKLRKLDKKDPAKYDFALFGLGVFENF